MPPSNHIDDALRDATATRDIAGVVAMAATDQGLLYEGAAGKRSLDGDPDMTLDTVFWIASMTKAITSVAALQLVEQGKLHLDQPLGELLPGLATPQILDGFDAGGAPRLRPANRAITLRHLLTHTAGFSYPFWSADIDKYMKYADIPGVLSGQKTALNLPLLFEPGERWEYGINTDWAGQAVEAASGKSLDIYLRDHIFAPLGMTDTGFEPTAAQRARHAGMHTRQADGSLQSAAAVDPPLEPEFFSGGAGLHGTARDYLTFLRMVLNGGTLNNARILAPETIAQMADNQISGLTVGPIKAVVSKYSNDVDFFPGMEKKWGFGFLINTENGPAGRSANSLSWAGLANTYYWIDPKTRVAGVILMQLHPFADAKALALYGQFERGIYRIRRLP